MRSQQEDRRSRKTKSLIQKALIEQLSTQELKGISVSEIAVRADINRGTFYLHYRDVYDVFEQLEQGLFAEFMIFIAKYKEYPAGSRISVLLDLFQYIAANSEVFTIILHTKEATILSRIIESSRPQNKDEWEGLFDGGDITSFDYRYEFVAYGCVAMLRRWFEGGMVQSAEQMATLAEELMAGILTAG